MKKLTTFRGELSVEDMEKGPATVGTREETVSSSPEADIVNPDSARNSWLKTALKAATNANPPVRIPDLGVRDGRIVVCVLNLSSKTT